MAVYIMISLSSGICRWISCGSLEAEEKWRGCKNFPHYRYLARPVYKLTASYSNAVIATAISFFATDLVMHQLLPQATKCLIDNVLRYPSFCEISWSPGHSLAWISFALPVMYAKYKRS